jgi:hypothetical protein
MRLIRKGECVQPTILDEGRFWTIEHNDNNWYVPKATGIVLEDTKKMLKIHQGRLRYLKGRYLPELTKDQEYTVTEFQEIIRELKM